MPVVVVLTALELEYAAVRALLRDHRAVQHEAGTVFEVGHRPGGTRPVALAAIGEGNHTAAAVTERAAQMFAPEALLFVGIAGALHGDIALGDVVVATRVYSYHSGAEDVDGFRARPRAWDAPHHLEQLARYVGRSGDWRKSLQGKPEVHFRPIAAGEVLLNATDSALAAQVRRFAGDAAAIEMEAAGVARAAHLHRALPALIVRGISDRADGGKLAADRAGVRVEAAAHAAAFAAALIDGLDRAP